MMLRAISPFVFSLLWVLAHHLATVLAHAGHEHDDRCGTPVPSLREEVVEQLRFQAAFDDTRRLQATNCDQLCDQCIEIETYLHLIEGNVTGYGTLIPHPTNTVLRLINGETSITEEDLSTEEDIVAMFEANIRVVNDAFAGTPFRFRFVPEGTTRTVSNDWSNDGADYQEEMSRAVGNRDLTKLDCFVVWSLREITGRGITLGIATLPAAQVAGRGDGVIVRYDVLTGGGFGDADLGYTLVHEIGHWLGLLHTFQTIVTADPCDPEEEGFGDFVDDTPIQNGPSSSLDESCVEFLGGERPPDTCRNLPGRDAFFNYMNYLDNDMCLAEEGSFTCGQIERMYRHWLLFRAHVVSCEDPVNNAEIEIVVELDRFYASDTSITLTNDNGDTLFNSVEDHLVATLLFEQEAFIIDRCLPRRQTYSLVVEDTANDGFLDGTVEIYVDRVLFERVEGNFGREVVVTIELEEQVTANPTVSPTKMPTSTPSLVASKGPSEAPSEGPSEIPTALPTVPETLMLGSPSVSSLQQGRPTEPATEPATGTTLVPSFVPERTRPPVSVTMPVAEVDAAGLSDSLPSSAVNYWKLVQTSVAVSLLLQLGLVR